MKKFYFWLLLQLALSSPILHAQYPNTSIATTPKILSSSSLEHNDLGSIAISIGAIHRTFSIEGSIDATTEADSTVIGIKPQDTTNTLRLSTAIIPVAGNSISKENTKILKTLKPAPPYKAIDTPLENSRAGSSIYSDLSNKAQHSLPDGVSKKKPFTGTSSRAFSDLKAAISVYPNPFVDRLTLFFDTSKLAFDHHLQYSLFDVTGNHLETGNLESGEKEIVLGSMPKGAYFIVLFQNGQELKSFKLLKTNL